MEAVRAIKLATNNALRVTFAEFQTLSEFQTRRLLAACAGTSFSPQSRPSSNHPRESLLSSHTRQSSSSASAPSCGATNPAAPSGGTPENMAAMGFDTSNTRDQASGAKAHARPAALPLHDVVILSAVRTPMGGFQGSLSSLTCVQLGAIVIKEALKRAQVPADRVDEVLMGNVISAGLGQAPTTQAVLAAGLPTAVSCTSVNKVCSSGMKAVMFAAQGIMTGTSEVVIAGGMESMSNMPHYVMGLRSGVRMGNSQMVDSMLQDGLLDALSGKHMGECAEMCAKTYNISRESQDAHAISSFEKARAAAESGVMAHEIVPVEVPGSRGTEPTMVALDEHPSKFNPTKLRALRPAFVKADGTITAGNASSITDGAAALVLTHAQLAKDLHVKPVARVLGFADANCSPEWFSIAPAEAVPLALQRAGLSVDQIDYWEVNEAFSVVDLVNQHLLKLDAARVNVHGGSVALGHPIGASGARIIVSLINVLRAKGGRYGCAAICNGGGGASALVLEYIHQELAAL